MKISATIALIIFSQLLGTSQSYVDSKNNKHLWGDATLSTFSEAPYEEWYSKNYEEHQTSLTSADAHLFKDISVKIFIGTWCGDTKHLFPRFIKSWEAMGLSEDRLEIIALHHEGENYKQGPDQETQGMEIHRVPTFIFHDNGAELGRIVERTVFDIDTDMELIAKGEPYQHRYQAIPIISELMSDNPDSLSSITFMETAMKKCRREISSEGELNTYAYTLLFGGEKEKSSFVFSLNGKLFPYDPYIRYGCGRGLLAIGKHEEAKPEFLEAIRLNPDLDRAIKYINEINEHLKEVAVNADEE